MPAIDFGSDDVMFEHIYIGRARCIWSWMRRPTKLIAGRAKEDLNHREHGGRSVTRLLEIHYLSKSNICCDARHLPNLSLTKFCANVCLLKVRPPFLFEKCL